MSLLDAALEIAEFLRKRGIRYAVLGGMAAQYFGEPRNTREIDLVVLVPQDQERDFIDQLLAAFTPRLKDAKSFALKNRVLLIASRNGTPIDISLGIPGYEEEVMKRTVSVFVRKRRSLRLVSAEDLIIHKCVAGRVRDLEDIEAVLIRQKLKLDLRYIRKKLLQFSAFIDDHDVKGEFESILKKARTKLAKFARL